MSPEEADALKQQVALLTARLNAFERQDRFRLVKNIELSKDKGVMIGTDAKQKLGFFGTSPAVQPTSPNGKQDSNGSGGTAVTTATAYNGNTGSNYYTVGDVVYALKVLGLLDT